MDSMRDVVRAFILENFLPGEDARNLTDETELKDAEEVLEKNRDADKPEELRAAFEKLQAAAHKLAEAMYKQAGPAEGGAPGGESHDAGGAPGGPAGGDVIDAEFEDKS